MFLYIHFFKLKKTKLTNKNIIGCFDNTVSVTVELGFRRWHQHVPSGGGSSQMTRGVEKFGVKGDNPLKTHRL